jgi:hypothetical protein
MYCPVKGIAPLMSKNGGNKSHREGLRSRKTHASSVLALLCCWSYF